MKDSSPTAVRRSILWSRQDELSLEYFQLHHAADDVRLSGTVITLHDGKPLRIEYVVQCDQGWVTKSVRIGLTHELVTRELSLIADDHRRWWSDGKELTAVRGCLDVDISLSPSTNTLPIRRLSLALGESSDVVAAWIRFPDLTLEPLPQQYVRSGENLYRYASNAGAFTADIEVDDLGLVVRYPPLWQRGV